jgi:hypothetical protein
MVSSFHDTHGPVRIVAVDPKVRRRFTTVGRRVAPRPYESFGSVTKVTRTPTRSVDSQMER